MQTLKPAALLLVLSLIGCTAAPDTRGPAPKALAKSPDVIAYLAVGGVT